MRDTVYVRRDLLVAADGLTIHDPKFSSRFLGERAEIRYIGRTLLPKVLLNKNVSFLFIVGSLSFSMKQSDLLSRRSFSNGVSGGLHPYCKDSLERIYIQSYLLPIRFCSWKHLEVAC